MGTRTQVRTRATFGSIVDARFDSDRFVNASAAANLRVGQARVRANDAVRTNLGRAKQVGLRPQLHVLRNFDIGADERAFGVPHGYAGHHVAIVDAMLHGARSLGELHARIHAHSLFGVGGLKREHLAAVVSANFQHVGEVVLALSVVVRNARKRIEKRRRIEAVEARVAFRDSGFFGRGVFLLNNADHSFALANDAAIPKRVVHMHGEHDHGRARLFALRDKGLNGFRSDKRTIARKNHERTLGDRAVGLRECLTTSVHGVARAELLGLNGDFRIALNKRSNLFGHMSEHGDHIFDAGIMGGVDDPAHERLAKHLMNNLGLVGFHAGSSARSKNQRFRGHKNLLRIGCVLAGKVYQREGDSAQFSINAHATRAPPH